MEDDFADYEISQEDLSQIDHLEFNLLNSSFHVSSEEENLDYIQPIRNKRRRVMVYYSNSEESDSDDRRFVPDSTRSTTLLQSGWSMPTGNQRRVIAFTEVPGMPPNLRASMTDKSPANFFKLLVPDEVFQLIVDNKNQIAINKITEREASKEARIRKWLPTYIEEVKSFFAVIVFMGLVKLPKISDYWSKD